MSRKNKQKENKPSCVCSPDHMSREEMTQMIADAIILAENKKTEKEPVTREEEKNCKYSMIKKILVFLVAPQKVITGEGAILSSQKLILKAIFVMLEVFAIVAGVGMIKSAFALEQELIVVILELLVAVAPFVVAAMFHIIRAEIENLEDKYYLLNFSTLVAALASIAIAIYSGSKGG